MPPRTERKREDYTVTAYQDNAGKWRWKMDDRSNGETVGDAHQGFSDPRDCEHNFYINTGWELEIEKP